MTYAFSLIFFATIVCAWLWSDHEERKDERRTAFRQGSCVRTIRQPFDYEKD